MREAKSSLPAQNGFEVVDIHGCTGPKEIANPRYELVDAVSRMLCYAGEDVRKPSLWIYIVHLGCDNEAVHGGRASPTAIRRDVMVPGAWDARSRFGIHDFAVAGRFFVSGADVDDRGGKHLRLRSHTHRVYPSPGSLSCECSSIRF